MYLNWMSTASFIALNKRGVKMCFNCIIGNTKLIHWFMKSFVSSLVKSAILKKKVVSIEHLKQKLSLDSN